MNSRFFTLPEERQKALINAGFKVFSQHEYDKAPMSQIAEAGDVSKSLLFHYFENKKGLYLHLWNYAARITAQATLSSGAFEAADVFDMLLRTTQAKCQVMRDYPYAFAFSMKAYYERNEAVAPEIQRFIAQASQNAEVEFSRLAQGQKLRGAMTPHDLYQQFLMLSDGYMLKCYSTGQVDPDVIERDFVRIIALWKQVFILEESHD